MYRNEVMDRPFGLWATGGVKEFAKNTISRSILAEKYTCRARNDSENQGKTKTKQKFEVFQLLH